ncbi:MAG: GtrA family protein [Betaproteobacteria bacterium]|nr:GtrA family protein [Betaproteobacteria bacterium]MBV9361626.1 GtrA family protein [Betaproteobacteria bacterium]
MTAARALTVGLICAVLHNAIVIGGDFIGLHYVLSMTISFAIVVVVGYWLHSGWTFPGARRGGSSFARYVLVAGANYPLSLAGMFVLVDLLGLPVPLASPILTVLLFAVNFLGNKWALHRAGASGSRQT